MPTYDYVCRACQHRFEYFQSMQDALLRKCPECGKPKLERLIGAGAGILFKGSGFYETDYKQRSGVPKSDGSGASGGSGGSGKSPSKAGSEGGESDGSIKSESSGKSDGKSEKPDHAKAEGKGDAKPGSKGSGEGPGKPRGKDRKQS